MSLCMQTEHGGHTNAYTASEDTNYHFECNWEALEGALDRFAQFFIAPLISEDGVEREVNAVDSECVLDQLSGQLSVICLGSCWAVVEHDSCAAILPVGQPACLCKTFLSAQLIAPQFTTSPGPSTPFAGVTLCLQQDNSNLHSCC